MPQITITIPGQTRPKKNSKKIVKFGKKKGLLPSDDYLAWAEQALLYLKRYPKWQFGYPVEIGFFFYRENKRKFDFSNLLEGPQDVLQEAGIIGDDDMNHMIPIILNRPGIGYGWAVDKHQPRVDIIINSINA